MREALASPRIRRLLAAYLAFVAAEWGTWLAILIYAYEADGAAAVGLVATAQLIPAAIVAPLAPIVVARLGRPSPLVFAYGVQALAVSATAIAALVAPSWVVYVCAAAMATSIGLARPAHATALVAVARTPAELTAATGAGGTVDGAGVVIGPIAVGVLYGLVGPGGFLAVVALALCGALALAASLRIERWQSPASVPTNRAALVEAIRVATGRRGPLLATVALVAAWMGIGLLDVLVVVLALGELSGGSELVGILSAALGVGGMVAGVLAARMVGAGGVVSIGAGLAIAAVGVAAAALLRAPIAVAVLLAIVGLGHGLAETGSRSLLIRLVPARTVGAVFGLIEGVYAASLAVGAAIGPLLLLVAPASARPVNHQKTSGGSNPYQRLGNRVGPGHHLADLVGVSGSHQFEIAGFEAFHLAVGRVFIVSGDGVMNRSKLGQCAPAQGPIGTDSSSPGNPAKGRRQQAQQRVA